MQSYRIKGTCVELCAGSEVYERGYRTICCPATRRSSHGCIFSRDEPVFGCPREVLTQVGRLKFLRPLCTALGKHARTQQLGCEIYDAAKETYHSLSRRVIEATMAQWATTSTSPGRQRAGASREGSVI